MASTLEMFEKPPRARPRVMMHYDDAGCGANSMLANFFCPRCGHRAGWLETSREQMRRGVPCPGCNAEPQEAKHGP